MSFKYFIFILSFIALGCSNNTNSNFEITKPSSIDSLQILDRKELPLDVVEPFDTSFDLFSINSLGFGNYHIEFIPISEGFLSGKAPDLQIIPSHLLGDGASIKPDSIYTLNGEYKKAALQYAGIKETDSLFIYNLNKNDFFKCPISQLSVIAFLNPYGFYSPVKTTDYVLGVDVSDVHGRKQRNYEEQELATIHSSNPFIKGGAKKIVWKEIDLITYPEILNKKIVGYQADRCFQYNFENFKLFCRVYTLNKNMVGFIIDCLEGDSLIFDAQIFSGEGSEPLFSLENEQPMFYNWTVRLLRGMPPILYNLNSLSFGCPKVFFIQEKELFKYITCDNRH